MLEALRALCPLLGQEMTVFDFGLLVQVYNQLSTWDPGDEVDDRTALAFLLVKVLRSFTWIKISIMFLAVPANQPCHPKTI